MGLRFQRPPLVEALCELRFESSPGRPWDVAIPGLMFAHVGETHPSRREAFVVEPGQPATIPGMRAQFFADDGTRVVQFGRDVVVVNVLAPHVGWRVLEQSTLGILEQYRSVAQPVALRGASLRYINRVAIPCNDRALLDDYFTILPAVPAGAGDSLRTFSLHTEFGYDNPRGALRVTLRSEGVSGDQLIFAVDYEHVWEGDTPLAFDQLSSWLTAAHDRIELMFYGSFTQHCHAEIFGEVRG